jgi:hypothetical protein
MKTRNEFLAFVLIVIAGCGYQKNDYELIYGVHKGQLKSKAIETLELRGFDQHAYRSSEFMRDSLGIHSYIYLTTNESEVEEVVMDVEGWLKGDSLLIGDQAKWKIEFFDFGVFYPDSFVVVY